MAILTLFWSKTVGIVISIITVISLLFGIRHNIRKTAKEELSSEIKDRTLERIKDAKEVSDGVASLSPDDVSKRLRDEGWLRE